MMNLDQNIQTLTSRSWSSRPAAEGIKFCGERMNGFNREQYLKQAERIRQRCSIDLKTITCAEFAALWAGGRGFRNDGYGSHEMLGQLSQ